MAAQQDRDALLPLLEKAASVQQFSRTYPQEKAYLHFDNTGYFIGETIWFKAYVTRTDTDSPTDLSGVLYVELLSPAGDVVERRKLELKDGFGILRGEGLHTVYGELGDGRVFLARVPHF